MARSPLLALLLASLVLLAGGESPYYQVPEPVIEALHPRGLRISIPDEPGVELFAVHANVNKPMRNLEAGQISRDITKATNSRWVFEDKRVRLKPGDVINFWLYVQADGLGYRKDDQTFTVKKLLDEDSQEHEVQPTRPSIPVSPPPEAIGPPGPPGLPGIPGPPGAPGSSYVPPPPSAQRPPDDVLIPGGKPQKTPCDSSLAQQELEQSRQRHELLVQQAKELHELRMTHAREEHREKMRLLREGCKIDDSDPPEMRVWRYRRAYQA